MKRTWTDRHTEVAEYLIVRGVSVRAIAAALSVSPTTIMRYIPDPSMVRRDYHAALAHNCRRDFDLLGVDPDHATAAIVGDQEKTR